MPRKMLFVTAVWIWAMNATGLSGAGSFPLRAGAAKVDITTPENLLPIEQSGPASVPAGRSFVSVHDRLFVRAIVVDDGAGSAAILALDLEKVPHADELMARITEATGIPKERIVLAATHNHNEPLTSPKGGESNPKWAACYDVISKGVVEAVRQAKAGLVPARVGFGTGLAYINVNNGEAQGLSNAYDPSGPSDKTVAIVKFESLSGEPIAFFINYAVHAQVLFRALTRKEGYEVSADLPGAVSGYVEAHYGNKPVAVWTSGAAADQEPEYKALYSPADSSAQIDEGAGAWALLDVQARRLGEESVRVLDGIHQTATEARIWATLGNLRCPGRPMGPRAAANAQNQEIQVGIPLGLLMVGDIGFATVGGEVATRIGQRIREQGASGKTIVVTQAAAPIGYILEDSAYQRNSHGVGGSPLKPGCAESGLPKAFAGLMQRYAETRP